MKLLLTVCPKLGRHEKFHETLIAMHLFQFKCFFVVVLVFQNTALFLLPDIVFNGTHAKVMQTFK